MMRRTLPVFLSLVVTLGLPHVAEAADDPALTALFGSEAEARGDFDTWLGELADAVAANPDSPYAKACVAKIRSIHWSATDPTVVENALAGLVESGIADGELEEVVRDLLASRARARGDVAEARRVDGYRGYLRDFAVIGPFGSDNDALLHRAYPPEAAEVDLSQEYEGARGPVKWLKYRPLETASAWCSPYQQIRQDGSGVTYALASVRTQAPGPVALKIWCSDSFKLFVNGEEVILADRPRDHVPSALWGDAEFVGGWNRVLVKITGNAGFALKVVDSRTGHPLAGVETQDPFEASGHVPDARPARPRSYRTPVERALELAESGSALEKAAAASMASSLGREWEALKLYEEAIAGVAGQSGATAANLRATYGRFLASFGPYPAVHRKLLAKAQFEAALAAYPLHNSASTRMASYENEDDHPDKAVAMLNKYLEQNPSTNAFMALANVCRARDWEREAIDAAQAALTLAPSSREALRFLAAFDKKYGNQEAYLAKQRELLRIDRSDSSANDALLGQLQAEGKTQEAFALLDRLSSERPASLDLRAKRARSLAQLTRYDEALTGWKELAAIVPEEEAYPREAGEMLELLGREAEAIASYETSLSLAGYQPRLWRRLARLRGEIEDFAQEWEPDAEEIIAKLPSTEELKEKYPKAVAITVLDHSVVRVRPDGSSSNFVHMIYKLLDEKGVRKYGDMPNAGELLEIRAIQPDGTVMKPTGLGNRAYNMEGLVPGTIVEHRYMVSGGPGPRGYDAGKFFFQDFELQGDPNPVLHSRYVVMAPPELKLEGIAHNYEGEPETLERDGLEVTVWEQRDQPRIDAERFMPDNETFIPHVDYSRPRGFEDANWDYLGNRGDSRPTPPLKETLADVVKPGMTDMEKLHAIYAFVNEEITGDFGGGSPTATLMEKAGSRSGLFEALIRTAGVPYRTGRAMAWDGTGSKMVTPTTAAFRAGFLLLEPAGADPIPFFMGSRHTPFGLVPEAYRDSAAFIADELGGQIIELPAGGLDVGNGAAFTISLNADTAKTSVAGTVYYRSPGGYNFKKQLAEMSKDDQKKFAEGQVSGFFANPSLEDFEFPGLDAKGLPLEINLTASMSTYLSKQGDAYVVSLGLPAINMTGRFVDRADRKYDLDFSNIRDDRVDEFVIDLGGAYVVESLPESHLTVNDLGTYSLTWRHTGDKIVVRRERHLRPARYEASDYKPFVKWCKAIDDAEGRKLTLRAKQ